MLCLLSFLNSFFGMFSFCPFLRGSKSEEQRKKKKQFEVGLVFSEDKREKRQNFQDAADMLVTDHVLPINYDL